MVERDAEVKPLDMDAASGVAVCDTVRVDTQALAARPECEERILPAELLKAQEQERKRIARELHDGIGQRLSAIKFLLEGCFEEPLSGDGGSGRLHRAVRMTQEAMEEVRRIAMDLRPAILDDLGIVMTIDWFCREFAATYPHMTLRKEIRIEERDVEAGLKTGIFRIVQEAMNNTAKHAGARTLRVELKRVQGAIRLRIGDDGRGFDCGQAAGACGLGLKGMRERAELAGGVLNVRSAPGMGTIIEAVWKTRPARLLR